ncbi:hypothetical protein [Diaminobutyricimonas sp. LJ205]|uniref:hypothetical protein n=1 Tax=Diaminobutyricimonas sp. LJ205 TaxID=2683590 RepID=UPI0012F4B2B6|nr:hypothetical protein [Diaminobutyricimonas sp. LJ205]
MTSDQHDATETKFRELLADSATHAALPAVDATAVVRRSRRRRAPRLVAAGGAFSLAAVGIAVAGVQGIQGFRLMSPASESASSAPESASDQAGSMPSGAPTGAADTVNPCGGTLAAATDYPGLSLTTEFPTEASTGSGPVEGTVILTNTGDEPLQASSPAVAPVTLSQDGRVLWHTSGPMILSLAEIALEPGQSHSWPASFTPIQCLSEAELDADPATLPAAEPGLYQLSAAIDLTFADGSALQFVGTPANITLK